MVNLYPQNGNFNKGVWKQMENRWAGALDEDPPKTVQVDIELKYDDDGERPSKIKVREVIDGGRPEFYDFRNAPGGA